MQTITIRTERREQLINLTQDVETAVRASGVDHGIVVIQSPHTTLAMTVNENTDPAVGRDMMSHLSRMVPQSHAFEHAEDNSDSHIKVSLVGPSVSLIVDHGQVQLGTWQGIYACEFDGPRERRVWIQVVGQ